jgi:hypothetical protein
MKPPPSPWPVAEAFGLGAPTGPLVAIASGPSAVHRSWRLSTRRGRFAVKAFDQDLRASSAAALEGPVRLELAAFAAGVPMPRPCLAVETGAGVAEVAGLGPQPLFVRVHEWVEGTTPTAPAPMGLAAELGAALAMIHGLGLGCGEGAQVDPWYRAAHGGAHWLALVEGYRGAGGGLEGHSPTVLAGSLSAAANWLELNVRRSLDQAADRPFRLRAEAEVAGALAELSRRLVRLDRWTELLG